MKASGVISALIFAHAAFAQASDASSSTSTSTTRTGTKSGSSTQSHASSSASERTPTGTSYPIVETQTADSGNPLVPSSASSTCTTFLTALNTDTALSSCFTPLLNALSAFNPISGTGSASSVSKTLTTLCSSNACSTSTMRAKLTEFKDACGDELTGANPNQVIINNYDVLFALIPFKAAVCSKDAKTQTYCLLNAGSGSSQNLAARSSESEYVDYASGHLANALVASSRSKRAQSVLVPNADTYRHSNLMYLFTSPDMNAGELCTSCTQQIISKYVAFESSTPYALGLKNSPLLGAQSELWAAMQEKCPATFLSEVTNIAGVISVDRMSGALPALDAADFFTAVAGALVAALALV